MFLKFKETPFLNRKAYILMKINNMTLRKRMILESILEGIKTEKRISRQDWHRLLKLFDDRFISAWKLVTEKRIKRYVFRPSGRTVWIAVGRGGEYLIYPRAGYCGCNDFYFRVVDREEAICYHLLAQKLAKALDSYELVKEEDSVYDYLLEEWRLEALSNG